MHDTAHSNVASSPEGARRIPGNLVGRSIIISRILPLMGLYPGYDFCTLRSIVVLEDIQGSPTSTQYGFDYDATGQQIRRTAPNGEITHFVHGRAGQLLGEYSGSPRYGKEYGVRKGPE